MKTIPTRFSRNMLHDDHSPTHHRKILQYIHMSTSTGGKTRRSQNADTPTGPIHRVVTVLEEPPLYSNQWSSPLHMLSHDTWPYTDAEPPVSNPSPVLFWMHPLPHTWHPTSPIHGRQRNYWHMVLDKGQTGHHPAHRLPLHSRHMAAFSQYVNMAQPQTRSHLMGRRSYGLFCDQPWNGNNLLQLYRLYTSKSLKNLYVAETGDLLWLLFRRM